MSLSSSYSKWTSSKKRLALHLLAVFTCLFTSIYFIFWYFGSTLATWFFADVEKYGHIDGLKFVSPTELRFQSAEIPLKVDRFAIPLKFDTAHFYLSYTQLLAFALDTNFTAIIYEGGLTGSLATSVWDRTKGVLRLDLRNVTLQAHPLAYFLSTEGLLSLSFDAKINTAASNMKMIDEGLLKINIKNLRHNKERLIGLIKFPAFLSDNLTVELNKTKDALWLTKLYFSTNLADITARGKCSINDKGLAKEILLNIDINLREEGEKTIGAYLVLASNLYSHNQANSMLYNDIENPSQELAKKWKVKISGRTDRPEFSIYAVD